MEREIVWKGRYMSWGPGVHIYFVAENILGIMWYKGAFRRRIKMAVNVLKTASIEPILSRSLPLPMAI